MKFKDWIEGFLPPTPLGDIARRADLIHGGLDGCTGNAPNNMPMGMRSACQSATSAFPTYSLPKKKMKKR